MLLLGGILVNNYVLQNYMGVCAFVGGSKDRNKALALGIWITVLMVVAAALAWVLDSFVLAPLGLTYLRTLIYVALILALVYIIKAVAAKMGKPMGGYFPMLVLNTAVLGVVLDNITAGYGFIESVLAALGVGLGFLLGMQVYGALCDKIEDSYVPKAFKGLPVRVLALAIISMVVFAFK